jgi:hypothetical protein
MKRSSGALLAAAGLLTLALIAAALLPIVECPRLDSPTEESYARKLVRELSRRDHDGLGCTVCDGRGKVTVLRRLLWRPPPPVSRYNPGPSKG